MVGMEVHDIASDDSDMQRKVDEVDWKFSFQPVEAKFPAFEKPDNKELIRKWNIDEFSTLRKFKFDQPFQGFQEAKFAVDFFNDPVVQQHAPVVTGKSWGRHSGAERVETDQVACTVTSMEFFDKLTDCGVIRDTGHIRKCANDFVGGVEFDNELRRLFLDPDSDHVDDYSEAEKSELLWHVMRWLALGGSMCQWDDQFEPYLDLCRALYKDLVSVHKTPSGIKVGTHALKVKAIDGPTSLFPDDHHPANSCFLLVDPIKRTCIYWYTAWVPIF
jgi:hypothetical protein